MFSTTASFPKFSESNFTHPGDRQCGGYSLIKADLFEKFKQATVINASDFAAAFPLSVFRATTRKAPWIVDVASVANDSERRGMAGAFVYSLTGRCERALPTHSRVSQSDLRFCQGGFNVDSFPETARRNRAAIALATCTTSSDCTVIRDAFKFRLRPTLVAVGSAAVAGNLDPVIDLGQVCTLCFDPRACRLATGIKSTGVAAAALARWGLPSFLILDSHSSKLFGVVAETTLATSLAVESQSHYPRFWGRLVDQLSTGMADILESISRCTLCSLSNSA